MGGVGREKLTKTKGFSANVIVVIHNSNNFISTTETQNLR